MKIVALILGTIVLILGTALADNPKQSQWTPPFIFNGGINIMSDKGQLEPNQLLDARNFIWRGGQLKVREGFKRYVAPNSGRGIEFIDIFGRTYGDAYLFYSDGERLWVTPSLTSNPIEISLGLANASTVDTYGTLVRGNSPTAQKWRTIFGSGEGLTITINATDYVIDRIITDTSMVLETSAGNQTDVAYSISNIGIGGINAFQLSNKYWVYSNTGRLSFSSLSDYAVEDTVTSQRFTSTAVTRECWTGVYPSLKFTATVPAASFIGKFLRIMVNPKNDTAASTNPLPVGHHYYTTFPVFAGNSTLLYTYNTSFLPDDTLDNFLAANNLAVDTTTKTAIILDSVVSVAVGELSCTDDDSSRYLKLFKSDWTDTAMFIEGDWFVSPMTQERTLGSTFNALTRSPTHDTIRAVRVTMPAGEAGKVYRIGVQFNSVGTDSGLIKGALYNSDTLLVDTTLTRRFVGNIGSTVQYLSFTAPVDVACGANYWLAVWSDANIFSISRRTSGGAVFATKVLSYTGTFPDSLRPTVGTSTSEYSIKAEVSFYSSSTPLMTSFNNCLPVVGGYLDTANNFIYVGVANEGQADPARVPYLIRDADTTKLMFFRMKASAQESNISGYRFVTVFQDRAFTARDTTCNQIEWSEPFLPDSTISTSVMIINSGDGECITGAMPQFADLVVYEPNSRWKIFGDGTNSGYGKERMAGSIGCLAKGSMLNIDGNHYFLHSSGYYVSDGSLPVLISGNVNSYFTDSINTSQYDRVASGYDQERENLWISFPRLGSSTNDITLVYNVTTKSWWRENINIGSYYFNPNFEISDSVRFMIGSPDSSTILFRGGGYDDGVEIDAHVQTGYMDFGEPNYYKRIEKFHLRHHFAERDSVTYWVYSDTMSTPVSTVSYIPHRYSWTDRKVGLPDAKVLGERLSSKWMFYNAGMMTLPFISLKLWLGDESEGIMDDEPEQ